MFVLSVQCVVVVDDYSAVRVSVHGHNMCGAVLDECCGADVLDCVGVGSRPSLRAARQRPFRCHS